MFPGWHAIGSIRSEGIHDRRDDHRGAQVILALRVLRVCHVWDIVHRPNVTLQPRLIPCGDIGKVTDQPPVAA